MQSQSQEVGSLFEFLLSVCIWIYSRCIFFVAYQLIDWEELLDKLWTDFLRVYFLKFESTNSSESCS